MSKIPTRQHVDQIHCAKGYMHRIIDLFQAKKALLHIGLNQQLDILSHPVRKHTQTSFSDNIQELITFSKILGSGNFVDDHMGDQQRKPLPFRSVKKFPSSIPLLWRIIGEQKVDHRRVQIDAQWPHTTLLSFNSFESIQEYDLQPFRYKPKPEKKISHIMPGLYSFGNMPARRKQDSDLGTGSNKMGTGFPTR
jgi:hypothetical protein